MLQRCTVHIYPVMISSAHGSYPYCWMPDPVDTGHKDDELTTRPCVSRFHHRACVTDDFVQVAVETNGYLLKVASCSVSRS